MSRPPDFRSLGFSVSALAECARFTGRRPYWRLYATENILRTIVHTLMTKHHGPKWWSVAVGKKKDEQVQDWKAQYLSQPHHSYPGPHDIYFLLISDLSRIMLEQAEYFRRDIPDIDTWIVRVESIRLPRNITAHMNWLNPGDLQEIDELYNDLKGLERRLKRTGLTMLVPS